MTAQKIITAMSAARSAGPDDPEQSHGALDEAAYALLHLIHRNTYVESEWRALLEEWVQVDNHSVLEERPRWYA